MKKLLDDGQKVDIIDVRNPTEFSIVHLPGSRNVPLRILLASPSSYLSPDKPTVVTCRLGNDSKIGAEALRAALAAQRRKEVENLSQEGGIQADVKESGEAIGGDPWGNSIMDLVGGLRAWSVEVDPQFPQY